LGAPVFEVEARTRARPHLNPAAADDGVPACAGLERRAWVAATPGRGSRATQDTPRVDG